jgi:predicted transcriptional regulator
MGKDDGLTSTEKHKKKTLKEPSQENQKIWASIAKNYEMIEGAQLSNSFIILMALNESKEPISTSDISRMIALYSGGHIYKFASTLKDSLEHRLKREGYVQGVDINDNKSLYSITPKGKKLLEGWIGFLRVYS